MRLFRRLPRPLLWLVRAIGIVLGMTAFYVAAGIAGSIIPANSNWTEPKEGIRIFVRTNGVHTWLMLPTRTAEADWSLIADPAHLKEPRYGAGDYVAIGFGNRDFYLNTPSWSDLTLSTAFAAAVGRGPGLVHVDHVWGPERTTYQHPVMLRRAEYARLAAHVRQSFVLDGDGRPKPLLGRGYGRFDIFYEAYGRYDARRTCNEWVGEALRTAGVKVGVWTPFTQSIMWRFD